jgi:hypothetical protein
MIETVRELISTNHRMTLRMMEEEVLSRLVQRIRPVRTQFQEEEAGFSFMTTRDLTLQYQ